MPNREFGLKMSHWMRKNNKQCSLEVEHKKFTSADKQTKQKATNSEPPTTT